VAVVAALLPACSRGISDAERAQLVAETERGVRAAGAGRFEVLSFHAEAPRRFWAIEYYIQDRFVQVPFEALVRFTRDVDVPYQNEVQEAVGAPTWTREQRNRDLREARVLGPGRHDMGTQLRIRAAGIFDDLEPGHRWRFLNVPHGWSTLTPSEGVR